jgi:hypothetical protein
MTEGAKVTVTMVQQRGNMKKKAKRVRTNDIVDTQVETTSGWTPVAKKCAHANAQVRLNLYGMEVDPAVVQE